MGSDSGNQTMYLLVGIIPVEMHYLAQTAVASCHDYMIISKQLLQWSILDR